MSTLAESPMAFPAAGNAPELVSSNEPLSRLLGDRALNGAMAMLNYSELPEGFHYAAANTIDVAELSSLMQTVYTDEDVSTEYLMGQFNGFAKDGLKSVEIGVRNTTSDKLAGYGGLFIDPNGYGMFGDFVVDPSHQSKGIGKAIIDQRLLHADVLRTRSIHIPYLEPTNTLRTYYVQRGFTELSSGTLVRLSPYNVA